MKKLKQFICGLFGHKFLFINHKTNYNSETHEFTIIETCKRCGKNFSFTIHEKFLGL